MDQRFYRIFGEAAQDSDAAWLYMFRHRDSVWDRSGDSQLMGANIQAGYSSLLVSVLFVGGVIMILLGMVGEYVGRIYLCINNAPQYVIREIVDSGTVKEELE